MIITKNLIDGATLIGLGLALISFGTGFAKGGWKIALIIVGLIYILLGGIISGKKDALK